jgi:hypothetical protein
MGQITEVGVIVVRFHALSRPSGTEENFEKRQNIRCSSRMRQTVVSACFLGVCLFRMSLSIPLNLRTSYALPSKTLPRHRRRVN